MEIYTFKDTLEAGDWCDQIQIVDSLESVWNEKLKKGANRLLARNALSPDLKEEFSALAEFWASQLNLRREDGIDLLRSVNFSKRESLFKSARKTGLYDRSLDTLCADMGAFKSLGGTYMKLRLQGAFHQNKDSVFHEDGASLIGRRYAGPQVQEAHKDDVIQVFRRTAEAAVREGARVFTPDLGDVWGHRCVWFGNKDKRSYHRKGPSNGKVGLILTLQ